MIKGKVSSTTQLAAWKRFFREDLWRFDFSELTRVRKSFYQALQVLFLVAEGFVKDRLLLRASALTYSTSLAMVPFLVLMFAFLKGIGIQRHLEPIILERISPGTEKVVSFLLNYIDQLNVGSIGVLGLVILVLTVFTVLSNVEASFNDIWGIRYSRNFLRKFSDYLTLVLVMPLLIFATFSLTASFKSTAIVLWMKSQPGLGPLVVMCLRLFPYFVLWIFFTFLFIFMPNTKVRFSSALTAGLLTGTLWQLTQWGFVTFQIIIAKHSIFYGTVAQLPVLFVWIFISWVIVLFGAELSFALQNVDTYRQEASSEGIHFKARSELALAFLRGIGRRFQAKETPQTAEYLAQEQGVPVRLAQRVLNDLVSAALLLKVVENDSQVYLPIHPMEKIPVYEVLERLEKIGLDIESPARKTATTRGNPDGIRAHEKKLIQKAIQSRRSALRGKMIGKR